MTKDNEKEEDKKKQVEVPNVENMTVAEAVKALKQLNLDIQIQEEPENLDKTKAIITKQLPKQGINVYEGTKILVSI